MESYGAAVISCSRRSAAVVGEHALGGGVVDDGPGRGRDDDGDVLLQGAVAGWVIRGAVLPAAPYDAAPGASEGADRAGVVVAAAAGGGVEVLGPGVVVAGACPPACRPPRAAACCTPSGSRRLCVCLTRSATAAWPASAASVSRVG